MYFDNLTLTGLLLTLAYFVMLFILSREKTTPDPKNVLMQECSKKESCRYGT